MSKNDDGVKFVRWGWEEDDPPRFLKDRFGKSCQGGKQGPEGIKSEGWLQEAGEGKTLPRKGVQKQRRRRR